MYADVRIKALAPDTTKPTVTVSQPRPRASVPAGRARQAGLRVRRRAGPDRVRRDAVQHRHAGPLHVHGHRARRGRQRDRRHAQLQRRRLHDRDAATVGATVPGDAVASRSARRRASARSRPAAARVHGDHDRERRSAPPATRRSPSADPGHLANGAFTLPQPLRVEIAPNDLERPGVQRPIHDHVQTDDRSDRRRAHRHLQPDADVHAVDDHALGRGPDATSGSRRC